MNPPYHVFDVKASNMQTQLPIEKVLPEIRHALIDARCAVIQAPPGAGKTTLVPLSLIDESWMRDKKIILLEPRRLAARASANRMAEILGEPLGRTIGYHIRMERVGGPDTKIEVVTEGIFTRRIQHDPSLEGVGLVIFDEFHERNLNSDLGLAFCLESMEAIRDDLRILVMSATLDVKPIARLLGDAPCIVSQGKSWPVETRYVPIKKGDWGWSREKAYAGMLMRVLAEEDGDILVFLPGVSEIKRLASMLSDSVSTPGLSILPLYGHLSKKEQDRVIQPSIKGQRKIVLATSIAETSVTIDGVRIVFDSGLMRVPRFFSGTGMSRLETIPASKASADQRRGRAGRTGPGVCYRLWSEDSHVLRKDYNAPEILNADLAQLALELAAWGVADPAALRWLDLPPVSAFEQARSLLIKLGALDAQGGITSHGKKMAALGVHPRLAHMMLKGKAMGAGTLACRIAALLNERDFLIIRDGYQNADIRLRLDIIASGINNPPSPANDFSVNRGLLKRIIKNAEQFEKMLHLKTESIDGASTGSLLAFAYPERIARARSGAHAVFQMASGAGAYFLNSEPLALETYIVAADLDGDRKNARIYRAAAYSEVDLAQDFGDCFETRESVYYDKKSGGVAAQKEVFYGELILKSEPMQQVAPERICEAMIDGIKAGGLEVLPWTKAARCLQARVIFLKNTGEHDDFPDFEDKALVKNLDIWLKPFLIGISSLAQLKKLDLKTVFVSLLTWEQKQRLEKNAPTHMTVPSGSRIPLDYQIGPTTEGPVLAVRLQEMFGLDKTPRIAGGKICVTLHLLSPANRTIQVTQDLESFWKHTYADVKKDLKGRYPKHYWPDDPLCAIPTNRAKPRK